MAVFDRFRKAPPSVSGRSSHDVLLTVADAAVTGLWALSGSIRRVIPPAVHDSSIVLTVVD
ncbi:MAG: oxidoreductase, partial [Mycobacterium sp.]